MKPKTTRTIGWALSGLLAAMLIGLSAGGKFIDWEGKAEEFARIGYTTELMTKIGVVEVIVTVLFLIPRTSFIGAILVTAYLGGATATHVRVGEPFYFPIIGGVLVWIALGLRRTAIFSLAVGAPVANEPDDRS